MKPARERTGRRSPIDAMPPGAEARRVAVFDIGKTNLKLCLLDEDGALLSEARRANTVVDGAPYPHFDVDAIWRWLLDQLSALPGRERIGAIVATTHGATVALLGDGGLSLPVLDYEFLGVSEFDAQYAGLRDDFSRTYSPLLPAGLNVGKQLYWQARHCPAAFARTRAILPYPQYWSWRLCGVAAGEVTSWGCHTDLWDVAQSRPSALAARMGWQALMPPLRRASDTLGCLLPEVAARTGLPAHCRVVCGIHDSNASLLKHFDGESAKPAPVNVISSGTWVMVASLGAALSALVPEHDMLANVDAWGRPVACARFMGGREFALLNRGQADDCHRDDIGALIARGTMALPSFAQLGGPWPGRRGEVRGPPPATAAESYALATLYVALVTDTCLERLNGGGDIVIEGALSANRHYAGLLAALRPQQAVWLSQDLSGTTAGAFQLASGQRGCAGRRDRVPACPLPGLPAFRARWQAALAI